jgi:KDO2-lipid IV(A) lauroyltransferase
MIKTLFVLIIKPLSRLPLSSLYSISSLGYLVIYKLFKYRRAVVRENIKNSFPNKSQSERLKIEKGFYRYLADLMVETVWMFGLTEARAKKRFIVENPELLDQYFEKKRSVIITLAHYSSWELVLSALNIFVKHQCETIYIPLTEPEFDRQYLAMRTRFKARMIAKKDFKNSFQDKDNVRAIIFGTDQSPSISKSIHWMDFLTQDTAVATGAEKYAKKYDMPVIYAHLAPSKRGYFNLKFELVTDTPGEVTEGGITEMHVKMLERQILDRPEYWLWSHKRWKKKRP